MDVKIDDDSFSDMSSFEEDEEVMDLFSPSSLLGHSTSSPSSSYTPEKHRKEGPTIPMKEKVGEVVRHHGSAFWIPFRKPIRRPESERMDVVDRLQKKLGIPDHNGVLVKTILSKTNTEKKTRTRQHTSGIGEKGEPVSKRRAIGEITGRRSRVVKRISRAQHKEVVGGKEDVASEVARRRREHRRREMGSRNGQKKSDRKKKSWI
jgi:hypothetical protein